MQHDFMYFLLRCKLPSWLTRLGIINESHYRCLVFSTIQICPLFKILLYPKNENSTPNFFCLYHSTFSNSRQALQSLLKSFNATSDIDIDELDFAKVIKLSLCCCTEAIFYPI